VIASLSLAMTALFTGSLAMTEIDYLKNPTSATRTELNKFSLEKFTKGGDKKRRGEKNDDKS